MAHGAPTPTRISGIALYEQRRFAEATPNSRARSVRSRRLRRSIRINGDYQNALAQSRSAGWPIARSARGSCDRAIETRQRQVALFQRALANGRRDVEYRAEADHRPSRTWDPLSRSRARCDQAIPQLELAVSTADGLIPIEPGNRHVEPLCRGQLGLSSPKALLSSRAAKRAPANRRRWLQRSTAAAQGRDSECGQMAQLQADCLATARPLGPRRRTQRRGDDLARSGSRHRAAPERGDPMGDPCVAAAYRLLGEVPSAAATRRQARRGLGRRHRGRCPSTSPEMPKEMSEREQLLLRLGRNDEARR